MGDSDVRQRDIDSSAEFVMAGCEHSSAQWTVFAEAGFGRTRDIYRRCAEISAAREDIKAL